MELIRLENIQKTYHLGEIDVPVLRGISLTIDQGEMVALMGASGSGKTTLMNILGCLDRPSNGKYWLDGLEMSRMAANQRAMVRSEKLGFVFQSFNLLPRTPALHNVLMPLDYARHRPHGHEARRFARLLLERVGLGERLDHEPSQMSGGQQQRVAIGRSLINRPKLLLADEPTGNLDSRTSVEILKMFQELNAEGITVILVTHDAKVATYADRTIHIVDGVVAADERRTAVAARQLEPAAASGRVPQPSLAVAQAGATLTLVDAPPAALTTSPADGSNAALPAVLADAPAAEPAPGKGRAGSGLGLLSAAPAARPRRLPRIWSPTLRTALTAIRRNTMRSALTALGIIMGVGAVIAMAEIGQGSKSALQKTITSMGANRLMLRPGALANGGVSLGSGSAINLTPRDVEEIARQCPSVGEVAPLVSTRGQVVYGNRNWVPLSIIGTTPNYMTIRDWDDMADGEMFTDEDVHDMDRVCVIGQTVKEELFPDESPVGQHIRIFNVGLKVIGVLSAKGANMVGQDQDDLVIMPWTTLKFRLSSPTNSTPMPSVIVAGSPTTLNNLYPGGSTLYPAAGPNQSMDTPQSVRFPSVNSIALKAASAGQIQDAIEEVTDLLRERHRLEGRPDDFNIQDLTEVTKALASTSNLMSALLLVVATISLVVGGVGIMNIMLVSVTERTREIGLRMAVGARSHHILRQFLVEAVVLCMFGGALGILLGRGSSLAVRWCLHWPVEASIPAMVAAVVVSAGVGVAFGFYPAWKASTLDPIEALRYE